MNNLDALYNLYMSALDDFPHGIKFDPDLNETIWYKQIKESLENKEKYHWHDRRKDPNDLPTEPGRKYIITQCGNEKYIVAEWDGMYFGDWSTLFSEDNIIFTPYALVDKWKEIERFDNE